MEESYPNGLKTMGKGEIAHYEQFLLFQHNSVFQKAYFPGTSKGFIVWEWVNNLHTTNLMLKWLTRKTLWKKVKLLI